MAPGAYLYLRVSTDEQVSNLSLDTQERECRELCAREGVAVVDVYREEGVSAKTPLERPQLQRLLAAVGKARGRVDRVVVCRVDRLSRNRRHFHVLVHSLERHGVRLVSVRERISEEGEESIESVIVETFSILQAQVDNMIRSGRTRAGMSEAARRGRWVWPAPSGYRSAPRGADGRPTGLELDPDQAPLVRRAFELVAAGAAVDAAHRELVAAGLQSRHGRPMGRETFHQMLRKPLYAGRLECAALGVSGASAAPAIVDELLWARTQAALAARRPARAPSGLNDFPLRGVLRCACGRRLSGFHARGKSGRRWPYYRCQRCNECVSRAKADAAFEALLARLAAPEAVLALIDRAIDRLHDQRMAEMQARLGRARRKLADAEARLERLLEMRVDGEISAEEFSKGRARAAEARDAARLEAAELTAPLDRQRGAGSAWVRRLLTRPAEVWRELGGERRAVLAERLFPAGITWSAGAISNPAKCLLAFPAEGLAESESGVVARTGFEPVLPT